MALATRTLPLACLMLLLLQREPGVDAQVAQVFKLQQPQDKVSVKAGSMLTLSCIISGDGPPGPVKWLKGWGSGSEIAYDQTGYFPRVTRAVDRSDTDFTIHISDIQLEDIGTYYCVKFRRSQGSDEVFRRGKGTIVSIYSTDAGVAQDLELQQPQDKVSVTVGETLTLTCTMSRDISFAPVRWLKGWGSGNQTVYDIYDQAGSFPRVTRAANQSETDFTIHIRDVCPEDAGTYYCVKFTRYMGRVAVFRRGNGTEVSVHSMSLLSSPGLWIGILLEKGLLGGLLVFLFKRARA